MPPAIMRPAPASPLVAALCALLLATAAGAQPRIELEPSSLAFGELQQNETRDVTVMIRNAGDQPLEIRDIESTCGCTVPELATRTIAPGEEVPMEVHFNSKTFQGKQIKYIHIYSNDPRRGSVDYLVTADIKVPLMMNPGKAMISFPTLKVGESRTVTYTFSSEQVAELEMAVRNKPEWLRVDMRPGSSAQELLVDFSLAPDSPAGRHREPVKLATNVPATPTVNLQVDARLVNDLVLGMEQVNLRIVRPGQALQTRVRVAPYQADTEFKLTRAEVDIPGLNARVENGSRESFAVLVGEALTRDHPLVQKNKGRIQGTLRIYTDLSSTPHLEVPVRYLLRI